MYILIALKVVDGLRKYRQFPTEINLTLDDSVNTNNCSLKEILNNRRQQKKCQNRKKLRDRFISTMNKLKKKNDRKRLLVEVED